MIFLVLYGGLLNLFLLPQYWHLHETLFKIRFELFAFWDSYNY